MANLSNNDVSQALAGFSEDDVLSGPVLTDEQARLFSEIAATSDAEEKAAKTSETIEKMLAEVEEGTRRMREIYEKAGVDPDQIGQLLGSERLSGDARREFDKASQDFQQQVMQAVNDEASRLSGGLKKPMTPRMGRLRV